LKVEIERFWVDARNLLARTEMHVSIHLIFSLWVKSKGQAFSQHMYVERNKSFSGMTPETVEERIGTIVANMIDSFLRDPYPREAT